MVWLAVLVLPQASVAVQVRVTLYCTGALAAVLSRPRRSGQRSLPQASLTVAVANTGVAGHSIVRGSPALRITGAVDVLRP